MVQLKALLAADADVITHWSWSDCSDACVVNGNDVLVVLNPGDAADCT